MKILAIDPSTTSCGWALFNNGVLEEWGEISNTGDNAFMRSEVIINQLHFIMVGESPDFIISEYPHKGGPGMKSKSITVLFHFCGMLHGIALSSHINISFIEPNKWKGNIPKAVHQKRMIPIYEKKYDIELDGLSSDIVDAIGIGDWYLSK